VSDCPLLAAALLMATGNRAWGAEPQITLSANQLNFPAQIQETQQLAIVTNSGQADLSITGITINGENIADFAQTNDCPIAPGLLAPRTRYEIRLTFSPTVTGTLAAAVNIADNASGSPQTVSLRRCLDRSGSGSLVRSRKSCFWRSAARSLQRCPGDRLDQCRQRNSKHQF
jgi:HYDIN/CFA65/VesB family protein